MVVNSCTFVGSASYPNVYMAGLCIKKLGTSSVTYKLALFPLITPSEPVYTDLVCGHMFHDPVLDMVEQKALVMGEYIHVFVDPKTKRSTPLPMEWRNGLEKLMFVK